MCKSSEISRWWTAGRLLAAVLVAGVMGAACSGPPQRDEDTGHANQAPVTPSEALATYADRLRASYEERLATARRWGLPEVPLIPPEPPRVKPSLDGDGLPPVITRVPTTDRVVFLTIDDGAEKDPEFTRMMRELNVPFSAFLSDYLVRDEFDYFLEHRALGNFLENHTINHPDLKGLSYEGQLFEICEQQDRLERLTGDRPRLFRPPYGNYNTDTLRAAARCGVRVIPLWSEELFPDRLEYREPGLGVRPGDIILTHFRGPREWGATMTEVFRNVLEFLTDRGFAVARLEDYI